MSEKNESHRQKTAFVLDESDVKAHGQQLKRTWVLKILMH